MTEQVPPTGPEDTASAQQPTGDGEATATATTGVPAVDRVLTDLDALDEAPLEEHLVAFERAHESLRSALDAPAVDRPGDPA
jgi:hypothetical protein